MEGPKLVGYKVIGIEDSDEADVLWRLNMMKQLGTSQHNMASCSVTSAGDLLFVNTSNGVDEGHINLPSPAAPSFVASTRTRARSSGPTIRPAPTCCTASGRARPTRCWAACRKCCSAAATAGCTVSRPRARPRASRNCSGNSTAIPRNRNTCSAAGPTGTTSSARP